MKKFLPRLLLALIITSSVCCDRNVRINRYELVTRHNIENSVIDSLNSLSAGNGEFAFTVDITGLQTFPEFYSNGIALGTMSNWGWHKAENPRDFRLSDVYRSYQVHGRSVEYPWQYGVRDETIKREAANWLRENPHRIHLGMIGLQILKKDGSEFTIKDIRENVQKLNLWTGEIESRFKVEGVPVFVTTVCHPDHDMISARIESELIREDRLKVKIHFPLGVPHPAGYDFNNPDKHITEIVSDNNDETLFERNQDNDRYFVKVLHEGGDIEEADSHLYLIGPDEDASAFEFSCRFSKTDIDSELEGFSRTMEAGRKSWEEFWMTGGAVDFSECTDPRAYELERRVILSQYLTRIQCSGSYPPAETGLTYNSWFGKFHLEMHWWHAVHFALWKREEILEKQMEYYFDIIENARQTAEHQGYTGVRWPKMTSPEGKESPSNVGPFLIWQQPHSIFFADS